MRVKGGVLERRVVRSLDVVAGGCASAYVTLAKQSGVGRPVEDMEDEFRDWIIDFGDSGRVVRYRVDQRFVTVLAVRHQIIKHRYLTQVQTAEG